MKVAFLSTSFPSPANPASGLFVFQLAKSLAQKVELTVLTPAPTITSPEFQQPFPTIYFRYAPAKLQILAHQPGGVLIALKTNILNYFLLPVFLISMFFNCLKAGIKNDLIHANWSINGLIAGMAGMLTRTPVITTLRGSDVKRLDDSWLHRILMRICLKLNRRVIAVGEAIAENINRYFPNSSTKVVYIPNGVDNIFYKIKTPIASESFNITTNSNLIQSKGIDTIIKALASLDIRQPFKLNIIGLGPEINNLKKLSQKYDLVDKIIFHGQITPDKVADILSNTSLFIMASHNEGRPNALLEAMAAGRPIIATDIDGIRELLADGGNGLFFTPGNYKELSSKIQDLMTNLEKSERLAENAKEFIINQELTWEKSSEKYTTLYKQVLHDRLNTISD